ncbi:MAG: hypothetical protein ACRC8Q_10125, partial [Aeromonas sp.]
QGLTTEVFHLKIDGHHWCLKRRRPDARAASLDDQTAFLTELERRREIEALRELHPTVLPHAVCTSFGSARAGVLVSSWLRGEPVRQLNARNLTQMLAAQGELARWGWFDWDPSPDNLLDDGEQISVFDFGRMWTFDPRFEFHSNGMVDPQYHVPERLETCTLSGLWLDEPHPLAQFRHWREACVLWVKHEINHLTRDGASGPVLARLHNLQQEWSIALASDEALAANWWRDMYRSHRLMVVAFLDDPRISRDPFILRRLDWLTQALTDHYPLLGASLPAAQASQGEVLQDRVSQDKASQDEVLQGQSIQGQHAQLAALQQLRRDITVRLSAH